jgi:TPR repeat protein
MFSRLLQTNDCPFCRSPDAVLLNSESKMKWQSKLVERGDNNEALALLDLGYLYRNGNGPATEDSLSNECRGPDDTKSLRCFEKAASLGNADACYAFSVIHKRDYNVADYLVCVKKVAELGAIKAHKDLADLAMKAKNYNVAMAHYKVLASVGYDKKIS